MDILRIDREKLWHPYASMTDPPPVSCAVKASGCRIELADGRELIDALSSWWCVCHGHNHPAIVEAITVQAARLNQVMFAGFTHEPAARLAELLTARTPEGLNKVFFADSGSVAVECAAKLAIQYQMARKRPGRHRLLALAGGYHGDTAGAMALSDPGGMHRMFAGLLPRHFFAPQPATPFDAPWDARSVEPLAQLLETHRDEIAAVILEPVFQGANAMRFYHPEYLKCCRELCSQFDILLIFDEIATGCGRLGPFFAAEFAGIAPDVMCVGKGLTGGAITLAAMVASDAVAETVSAGEPGVFMHGPTFMANPLACAAGCASLELFGRYDWRSRVAAIERQLRDELAPAKTLPGVREVRVLGAVGVIELAELPSPERVREVVLAHGVWLRPFGRWLYAMPPFVISPEELSRVSSAMLTLAGQR